MDCNGCVQKIKKAIHTIDGVRDINVDIHQQKITVVGGADPELLVKAIKKTKKTATICSHAEPASTSTEPPTQPPGESPPAEATPPTEPPKDVPPAEPPIDPPPPPETPEGGAKPSHREPNDVVEEVRMMHHHYPHNYVHGGGHWNNFPPVGHETRISLAPYHHVMHSYDTHRPSPYVTEYVSDYGTPRDTRYDGYGDGYYQNRQGSDGNQITSIFSDENPNSCTIV